MNCRTDLAIEAAAQAEKLGEKDVRQATSTVDGVHVSRLQILSPQGAAALGKPIGQYVTAQLPPLSDDEKRLTTYAAAIAQELTALSAKVDLPEFLHVFSFFPDSPRWLVLHFAQKEAGSSPRLLFSHKGAYMREAKKGV